MDESFNTNEDTQNTFPDLIVSGSPFKQIPSYSPNITGRRIIGIKHFITAIQCINHKPFSCSCKDMLLESE